MKFCVECGQTLTRALPRGDDCERLVCGRCGHVHYDNPKILVWCFAHCRDRLLLCRRAIPPARGLWAPPAGFVEMGETLEEAAAREMREEVGITVDPAALILYRVASIPHMNQVYVGFRLELPDEPDFALGTEVLEARFCSEVDVPIEDFAFRDMLKDVPEDFFRSLRSGIFSVHAVTLRVNTPDVPADIVPALSAGTTARG